MPVLEIIKPGLLTTLQDAGRRGGHFYAIPASGAMDPQSAAIALLLLRAPAQAPLLECTSIPPMIRFHGPGRIALSGADFQWTINEQPVPVHFPIEVQDGDVLAGKHAADQLRGYIAVQGEWQGQAVYGSHATYLNGKFGGYQGRVLRKGDRIEWKNEVMHPEGIPVIPLRKGPEYDWLSPAARQTLVGSTYLVGVESNRMGARLEGPKLECKSYQLEDSAPVLPGFIQLPPSGLPIVVLQDGQVSGGYPRIAYIPEPHLGWFNQIPLGKGLRFDFE